MTSSLIPIRIDAWSSDRSIRIVDTLLYDSSAPSAGTPDQLAYHVCADAEVMGMGRTVRHFTNRVDLWKPELQHEVARQISTQLQAAAARKRNRIYEAESGMAASVKKVKEEPQTEDAATVNTAKQEATEVESDSVSQEKLIITPQAPTKETVARSCKHIRLRLSAFGVRVHDDFFVDVRGQSHLPFSPLQMAKSIGSDLNLSHELVQAIAVEIAEQLHGRHVQDDSNLDGDEGNPPAAVVKYEDNVTASWLLDQRVHISNVANLVQQHRPLSKS